jgi:signal transduction histidine kinase
VFSLKNNGKWFLLGLLGPVLPLLFFDPVLNFFNVGYFQIGLHEETYSYNNVRAFISILVIGFSSYFLKRLIENSEQLNDSLINELVEKNARIAEQNEKLREQQEELRSINQNLEGLVSERTEKIKAKNKQITKYAFTNSHRVRGPLARILGLLALSKLNNQEDYKFLFEKIQKEAMDMDAITHEINTDLDDDVD